MRPTFDEWFRDAAQWASKRADCRRRKVGAVIVKDQRIIATGYNGALPGETGCLSGGCPRGLQSYEDLPADTQYAHGPGYCTSVHAELNALLFAAKHGISVLGATMYVTDKPCPTCSRLVQQAGMEKVIFG